MKLNIKDNTRNERQARRRLREKKWLKENGWKSWEALHTALMNGMTTLSTGNKMEEIALKKHKQ
jgi:hypothetical protein